MEDSAALDEVDENAVVANKANRDQRVRYSRYLEGRIVNVEKVVDVDLRDLSVLVENKDFEVSIVEVGDGEDVAAAVLLDFLSRNPGSPNHELLVIIVIFETVNPDIVELF